MSAGCKHCYAQRFAERFRGISGHPFEQGFDIRLVPEKLVDPLRWKDARMVFVNSMSDLFHVDIPESYVSRVSFIMRLARWHTYQVLTKRSIRLRSLLNGPLHQAAQESHIWWGVSVEDRKHGLPRIVDLQASPANVRFLSVEPLLEDLGELPLEGISWVIVGGESGPGARPMEEDWVLSIKEQCDAACVPFFFKQWGGVRKKRRGRELLGQTFDAIPRRTINPVMPTYARLEHLAALQGGLVQIASI